MQNFLAEGFSSHFSWSENGAGVLLYGVGKYFSKFGLGAFLQAAHSPRWIGVGWSQLAPAQRTSAPGHTGNAGIQQRLEGIVQLLSPSAYSPPGIKPPTFGCLVSLCTPGMRHVPAMLSLACVGEEFAALLAVWFT